MYRRIARRLGSRSSRSVAAEGVLKSLAGQLLVAMPQMLDQRFARSVIYLCAHSEGAGAMGLVINKLLDSLTMGDLLAQLDISPRRIVTSRPIHFGGPVEAGRGFVLHTSDYNEEATLVVDGNIAVTATLEILRAIAKGQGPRHSLLLWDMPAGPRVSSMPRSKPMAGFPSRRRRTSSSIPTTTGSGAARSPSWASICRCSRQTQDTPDPPLLFLFRKSGGQSARVGGALRSPRRIAKSR